MKVIVYVEGPSDKAAMEALLAPLIREQSNKGIEIRFFPVSGGDAKKTLLIKTPQKAANIILNAPHSIVALVPDLYPPNKGFPHKSVEEMECGIQQRFVESLQRKRPDYDRKLEHRFFVFCFKYDLETLILASEHALMNRLGIGRIERNWIEPVEDQNHGKPPKHIVAELFRQQKMKYKDTVDAPVILGNSQYWDVAEKCPQCFKPFVDFLRDLSPDQYQQ